MFGITALAFETLIPSDTEIKVVYCLCLVLLCDVDKWWTLIYNSYVCMDSV